MQQLQKMIGVRAAIAFPSRDGVARELALVKVRAPHERYAELLDVVQLYNAAVVDDSTDGADRRAHRLRGLRPLLPPRARALRGGRGGPQRHHRAAARRTTFNSETVT